ncbi:MAG: tRNA uridine-5-carboxymethylaminomethyl(34) synthesis GTPase MnmE [Pseudomonadota bacterium]
MSSVGSTIFALATAPGRAGVAIIRVSGPEAFRASESLVGTLPRPRTTGLRQVRGLGGELIDEALILSFEAGASFTGEPVVEFHTHGSLAVVDKLLAELASLPGLRAAEAGDFTRRAFENGRLDLVQVEGLAELIEAETEAQLSRAQSVFAGDLSKRFLDLRQGLLEALSLSEAQIDFSDEELPDGLDEAMRTKIEAVAFLVTQLIDGAGAARAVQRGFEVAIVGPPNVGKSTLINAITQRDTALVSDIAGTTRDVIEARVSLGGHLVTFLDTAGLRATEDAIESAGVSRAYTRARGADLRLFLCNPGEQPYAEIARPGDVVRETKHDLTEAPGAISAQTGAGMSELMAEIADRLKEKANKSGPMASRRQEERLRACQDFLNAALSALKASAPEEIVAEELRAAVRELDAILGKVDVEEVLGQIFSSFCIGK